MFSICAIEAGYDRGQRYLRPLQSGDYRSSLVARVNLPNRVSEILNPITESDTPRHNPSRKAIGRLRSSKTGENT